MWLPRFEDQMRTIYALLECVEVKIHFTLSTAIKL
jgi:hypothetical protein